MLQLYEEEDEERRKKEKQGREYSIQFEQLKEECKENIAEIKQNLDENYNNFRIKY